MLNALSQSVRRFYFLLRQPRWYTLEESIDRFIPDPVRFNFLRMINDDRDRFESAYGSSNNHQAWRGGWYDHTSEVCNYLRIDYEQQNRLRPLGFPLADPMISAVAHDLEKPEKYKVLPDGTVEYVLGHKTKQTDQDARDAKLKKYSIELTPAQRNGMLYAEGEFDYMNTERRMWPIGALVHRADIASARLYPNYPLAKDDPWTGAHRIKGETV